MSGLVIASFVDSGLELHWIPRAETVDVGLTLVSVPFILQLIGCVFSYLARDGAAGAALGVLSSSWLALGLVHIVSTRPTSGALGLLFLASGTVLALSASAVAMGKPLPGVVFLAAALRVGLAGIYQLSSAAAWQSASGILGLVVTAMACYCVLAFELEGQRHAPVLPTFRHGRGAGAVAVDAGGQLDGIAQEAGVRQTS
jgi:hypothetical protein